MAEKLTQNDVKKIEEEIRHRKLDLRPQLIEAVKEARAQGDLSENFEYTAARQEKNRNDSRIRYLENLLRHAVIISDESGSGEVGLNKTVTVYFEDDDEEETYKLVTDIRGDSLKNLISTESPLGKALLKKKVGDRVKVTTDTGLSYYVVVRKIENTDDTGDAIRTY